MIRLPLVLPCLLFTLASALTAHAQISTVKVRLEQSTKNESISYKNVQERMLSIYVSNTANEPIELKVKYAVFGRDMKSNDIVTVQQGELPVSLKPLGSEKLQTPWVRISGEDERVGSKGKSEASGTKMFGQGVQVLKGDAVVAEAYQPDAAKAAFGKAPPMTVVPKKKK